MCCFNIPEPDASNSEADRNYVSKLCKETFDHDIKILKALHLIKKVINKCISLLVQFENEDVKAKILEESYLSKSMKPYSEI